MGRIIAWLNLLLMQGRLSAAQKLAHKWKRDSARVLRQMSRENQKLTKMWAKAEAARLAAEKRYEQIQKTVDRVQEQLEKYDQTEEGLNRELQIYKEVILPDLTLAREVVRAQQEADIAMHARYKAVSGATSNRED